MYVQGVCTCKSDCYMLNLKNGINIISIKLVKLAKRLKKEKVMVDVVSFGEPVRNM